MLDLVQPLDGGRRLPRLGRCDSCGRDDEELTSVHRIYATPESWEAPATVQRLDEVEHWCFACLSHYPHERVDEGG